jgi:ABA DEFICIENT 4-like
VGQITKEAMNDDRPASDLPERSPAPLQRAWSLVNFSTVPFWVAMIVAPRSRLTAWLLGRAAPLHAALSVIYSLALITGAAKTEERIDFASLASVSRAFQQPEWMLAGWTHYITFDLLVGSWIWRRALEEDRSARLSLLLTWWAGPAGFGLFAARRRLPGWLD